MLDNMGKIHLKSHRDSRGTLIPGESGSDFPFQVRRFFLVTGVPQGVVRGEHAHKKCEQLLICVSGSVMVHLDPGPPYPPTRYLLNKKNTAVHIPPLVWGGQSDFSPGSVLLVLASHPYDPDDYIPDYESFLAALRIK